jgi:ribosomal protein L34
MQHNIPDDFVVATGETHSVEEFLELAFGHFNLKWQDYVVIDPALIRPAEVDLLLGDSTKLRTTLGWEPKVKFHDLVNMMIEAGTIFPDENSGFFIELLFSTHEGILCRMSTKRTYQPKKRKRLKTHGFRIRSKSVKGVSVLTRRRRKGRAKLTV